MTDLQLPRGHIEYKRCFHQAGFRELKGYLSQDGQGLILKIFGMFRVWATQDFRVNPLLHKGAFRWFLTIFSQVHSETQKCQLSKSDFKANYCPSKKLCKARPAHNFQILFLLLVKFTNSWQNSSLESQPISIWNSREWFYCFISHKVEDIQGWDLWGLIYPFDRTIYSGIRIFKAVFI